jgi:Reverse transcriptase (RNA-dependent DNA polymerase)
MLLTHGIVPHIFTCGVIVPVLKDRNGDASSIKNYRGITISPCISKLFEMCILHKFEHMLNVSPLQFGFQKKLSCSHAIYALRSITEYYTAGLSTVNVALLDMSSAFDKVVYDVLFKKLIKLGLPPSLIKLLYFWYLNSNVYVRWGMCNSFNFMLKAGVRQGGVLSPILFCIYVDCILKSLESSKLGCWIGDMYIGCIMYADDLVLISSSVCELQKMLDLCADDLTEIGMQINSKKCAILRFGPQYANSCTTIWFQDSPIEFCDKAKYLGIQLQSSKTFLIDLSYSKAKFYRAFNGLFHRLAKLRNELTTLHLVSSYCKPHLLYATECFALSVTQMRSLQHTWQCAVSHIFNVSGANVNFICAQTDKCSLDVNIMNRRKNFLRNMFRLNGRYVVLHKLFWLFGQHELYRE